METGCTLSGQDSKEVLLHMLEGNLLEWVQGRMYWVLWVGPSTAEEAPHTEEHCDDTGVCSIGQSVGKGKAWAS